MAKITHIADPDQVYGEGDWRPLLGEGPRKAGYKLHMIGKQSIDDRLKGNILPSFDLTLDTEDKSFFSSVAPCWTPNPDPKLKRHFVPNGWFMPLIMYPYLGETKEHWISPRNLANMIGAENLDKEDFADAFDDLNKWVRMNKSLTQSEKDALLKTKKLSDDPLVPGRTTRIISLAECKDKENDWHLAVVGYTGGAHSYLLEQMRWRHEDDTPPLDPNYPRYMLGDVTRPEASVVWHVDKVQLNSTDQHDTNVMCFTRRREFLDENQETRVITPEVLAARFVMQDPANWNIPTYEEQVMHMIERYAPEVTADMIRQACGHRCRCTIPDRPKNRTISNGGGSRRDAADDDAPRNERRESRRDSRRDEDEDHGDPMAAVTGGSKFAPTSAAPTPDLKDAGVSQAAPKTAPPAATTPAAPAGGETYWAGAKGQKATKQTVAQLQELIDSGKTGVLVQVNGKFVALEDSGLVKLPAPVVEDEAPIIEDEAPVIGEDEPPVVADEPPVVGDEPAGMSDTQMLAKLFPDTAAFNALPADLKAECKAFAVKVLKATGGGNSDVPSDMIDELVQLHEKMITAKA